VLQAGKAVEAGKTARVLSAPAHPYTQRLVDALPRRSAGGQRSDVARKPLVELSAVTIAYPGRQGLFGRTPPKQVVHGVDLVIGEGETVGLVGASGSSKTTIGRAIVGLQPFS